MVYDTLNKLLLSKRLDRVVITVFKKGAVNNREHIYGRDIVDVNRSFVKFTGGETGYEEFSVPLERILEIEVDGKPVFRNKKRIKKIYPMR